MRQIRSTIPSIEIAINKNHRLFSSIAEMSLPKTFTIIRNYLPFQGCIGRRTFDQDTVFNVVFDVDLYKKYLPFCKESSISNVTDKTAEGYLKFELGEISVGFYSKINYERPNYIISTTEDDIFESLVSEWRFSHLDHNVCRVDYKVVLSAKSPIYRLFISQGLRYLPAILFDKFSKQCSDRK
ncbi:Coenzyme Q-binding protein COQ10, mitochondrial [Thelohanellus kitauei]|uniref:Coenzyme Q-binding protein COQ10, mitochondrial n=1 Tax=Thelohanellus kitauei TaxID=669202 RepID=A0A0C2MM83_THEKT|nr:Coenzyme Q-binding protein COQ10, mitochondrial [Thelohanellus kitauei]